MCEHREICSDRGERGRETNGHCLCSPSSWKMSGCLVADDAAVIQVTRVISIQSQARGVIEMTTTERRRNKKHHNSGVAIIYIDKKYDHLNLHTYTTAERAGGWWGRIIIICMLLYTCPDSCMHARACTCIVLHVHLNTTTSSLEPSARQSAGLLHMTHCLE